MIAFQSMKGERRFIARMPSCMGSVETVAMLADAMPWHPCDEERLRREFVFLRDYRTITYSSRIDHPMNDLAKLTGS